jgi:hypothetical protein
MNGSPLKADEMRSLVTIATTLTMAAFVVWMATFGGRGTVLFAGTSVAQSPPMAAAAQPHLGLEG